MLRSDVPAYARYPRRMQRWVLNLLDASYKAMFTRNRKGDKLGVPRFRGRDFWNTIGWDAPDEFAMRERGIFNRKSLGGTLRLRPDRELPPFSACTMFTLSCNEGRWFANLTYEIPDKPVKPVEEVTRPVGIDVGLITLVMRSDGVPMDAPRQTPEDHAARRRLARALSRCKRRSKGRRLAKERLRKHDAKVARRRKARLHEISARLTHHFDAIAIEDLNVAGLNRGGGDGAKGRGVRKSWRDRAPGILAQQIKWKTQRDGRLFAAVDPKRTSIECSQCGAEVRKTLRDRVHRCSCGAVLDRDHNAGLNCLHRAGWGPAGVKLGVRGAASAVPGAGLPGKHGKVGRTTEGALSPPPSILRGEHRRPRKSAARQ